MSAPTVKAVLALSRQIEAVKAERLALQAKEQLLVAELEQLIGIAPAPEKGADPFSSPEAAREHILATAAELTAKPQTSARTRKLPITSVPDGEEIPR